MMKYLVILCSLAGLGIVQGLSEYICYDPADRIDHRCVNCTCEFASSTAAIGYWSCQQTCSVCPDIVVSEVCIINQCTVVAAQSAPCNGYPDAECVIPECESCDYAWLKDGAQVECCPDGVEMVNCLVDPCSSATCPEDPRAVCVTNYCGGCNYEFRNDEGEAVYCGPPGCPAGVEMVYCFVDPCLNATCPEDPMAVCVANYCGGCNYEFRNDEGEVVCASAESTCLSNPCLNGGSCYTSSRNPARYYCDCPDRFLGKNCEIACAPGLEIANCEVDPCSSATCPEDPRAVCVTNYCGGCNYEFRNDEGEAVYCGPTGCPAGVEMVYCIVDPCSYATCPEDPMAVCVANYCGGCNYEFRNDEGEAVDCGPTPDLNPCPPDRPFMNCTYDEVCSSPCDSRPNARCTIDHCGGCTPVYINLIGLPVNCTTGETTVCPGWLETVTCLVNPCDTAECAANPDARCVPFPCGECRAHFFNDQGLHVDCETGGASLCTPQAVETNATAEVCVNATCPAHPKAMCFPKLCKPRHLPLDCPYVFLGARGQVLECNREKPGECPNMRPPEGGVCITNCREDGHCEGDKKCCRNGCGGGVCTNPIIREPVTKPGTCPEPTMDNGDTCEDECDAAYGDSGCPRHWKCCHNGCGYVCTAPQEMPDVCPMVPGNGNMGNNCQQQCSSDFDCQGEEPGSKCCSHGCGTKCKSVVRVQKSGTCPMPMMGVGGICAELCISDDDCPRMLKCCGNGCGHTCQPPQEQPGECPRSLDHELLMASRQQGCSSDEECTGGRSKCCAYDCGKICLEPVREEKPGMCPMPAPSLGGICVEMCNGDQDCPGRAKCCSNNCGHTCTEPVVVSKPGNCPMVPPGVAGICVELCTGDDECPRNRRKCCSNGCGHTCFKPVVVKQGICPMPTQGLETPCGDDMADKCRELEDDGCPGMRKCCSNGCSLDCVKPIIVGCGEDGLNEICELDPCMHATCPSVSDAVCVPSTCGRCLPKFFVDAEEVRCEGQKFCGGLGQGDDGQYRTGTVRDSSDGCNQCTVIQVSVRLNGTFEEILNRQDRFIAKVKEILSKRFRLPVTSMRDFKMRKGSIIIEIKLSSNGTIDVEAVALMMKEDVATNRFSFMFDGMELVADPDSFTSEPLADTPPTSKPPKPTSKDYIVYIAIGVICALVVIIVVISLIVCSVKSSKGKAETQKSKNLEFNEYEGAHANKAYRA